jgi:hypothetical protein
MKPIIVAFGAVADVPSVSTDARWMQNIRAIDISHDFWPILFLILAWVIGLGITWRRTHRSDRAMDPRGVRLYGTCEVSQRH